MRLVSFYLLILLHYPLAFGEDHAGNKFDQLHELLPSPSAYRDATGAPGPEYWQQQADHKIVVTLNEETNSITGEQIVYYTNNSPNSLSYIWLQLE
ncbi:MAG: M1 family peptidase, partial [Pseudomonadota bacterium]